MSSRLIDTLLQALSLAEQLEEQLPPNPITHAALLHAFQDALEEVESHRKQLQSPRDPE